jgi:DNA-3-methyladenine glycosylase II
LHENPKIALVKINIPVPEEFSFQFCLEFLKRSPKELLHLIDAESVIKLVRIDNADILFKVAKENDGLTCCFLNTVPAIHVQQQVMQYIHEWFDLQTNLRPFYTMASKDAILKELVKKYYGYRIVGQPDLFESLVWAVLGQQINLGFAYTLKQRFVEQFGEKIIHDGHNFFHFPTPQRVTEISVDELLRLQFSNQKARYTIGIAEAFASGVVSKEKLSGLPLLEAKEELMKIKGIGNWTANYGLMKTFRYPDAFPLEDAGLHNAIKNQLGLATKPSHEQVKKIFKKYKGWEAYATLYLWKSL